jgi:predicted phosphoribosyltransferase
MFLNRQQAGLLLAKKLQSSLPEKGPDSSQYVVVALPRGGVPVAAEIAEIFKCQIDVLVSKKIHAIGNEELAIGAMSSDGTMALNSRSAYFTGTPSSYIDAQVKYLTSETKRREDHLRRSAGLNAQNYIGKWTIVVDDGIATGLTALVAVKALRQKGAAGVVLTCPVMSEQASIEMSRVADGVVSLLALPNLAAVGFYYQDFHQLTDEEVVALLRNVGAPHCSA